MTRSFIVVGEVIAVVADFENAALEGEPVERCRMAGADAGNGLAISGLQRLGGEQAQDVGQQKLLVLLLVIDAELDQLGRFRVERCIEQASERLIDESTIVAHLRDGRPREQPTLGAGLPRTDALIIGVEAIFEALVEHAIAGEEAFQQEGLEEPGGMREMPFGRARVVHGLHDLILIAQGCGKLGRARARGQ